MTARILVVDDVLPNIKLLEARLTAEYFEVLTATHGLDALSICAEGQCDIVLLDVMMPGMDGFEVCRRLKADPATAHIPVVMVTALDQPADRVRGLEAGADDFSDQARRRDRADRTRAVARPAQGRPRRIAHARLDGGQSRHPRSARRCHGRRRHRRPHHARRRPSERDRAHGGRSDAHPFRHGREGSAGGLVQRRRGRFRPVHRQPRPQGFRRPAPVQPDPLARAHAASADPDHRRSRTTAPACCAASTSA